MEYSIQGIKMIKYLIIIFVPPEINIFDKFDVD